MPALPDTMTKHSDLFEVYIKPGDFASELRSRKNFRAKEIICPIEGVRASKKAYSSVQVKDTVLEDCHIELESDLVYANHSCDPNVVFEVPPNPSKWVVRAIKDITPNDPITFAYFSTEWDMAQPFDCRCGTEKCLGRIQGARYLSTEKLNGYFINEHILSMIKIRDTLPN